MSDVAEDGRAKRDDTAKHEDQAKDDAKETGDEKMSTAKVLGLVGAVVSALIGGSTLLFTIDPGLKPCVGGAEVSITGAPVFPNTHLHKHLAHLDTPNAKINQQPNPIGAEIRFSLKATNLKNDRLSLKYSLVRVESDGALGRVDPAVDRLEGYEYTAETCSDVMGDDLFIEMPGPSKGARRPAVKPRYRVILELYRANDRLALGQTANFTG